TTDLRSIRWRRHAVRPRPGVLVRRRPRPYPRRASHERESTLPGPGRRVAALARQSPESPRRRARMHLVVQLWRDRLPSHSSKLHRELATSLKPSPPLAREHPPAARRCPASGERPRGGDLREIPQSREPQHAADSRTASLLRSDTRLEYRWWSQRPRCWCVKTGQLPRPELGALGDLLRNRSPTELRPQSPRPKPKHRIIQIVWSS